MSGPRALIVEDDPSSLDALAQLVELEGFDTVTATNLADADERLETEPIDVVLCDLILPDGRGTELLSKLADRPENVDVILVTGNASVDTAVEALRLGAYDYLTKPVDVARLKALLAGLHRSRDMRDEISALRGELRSVGRFGSMIGTSKAMQRVYDLVEKVAPTNASVFLVGESGTGKELVAAAVHRLSRRRKNKFIALNCGAVTPTLLESELFGHEKGSFTGATRRHRGYFERADGGTLFLDEITEMPLELQVKLLRVLETATVVRVGGDEPVRVDVRIIAATNRDPETAVENGKLRLDLLYRLNVFPIELPPLREREGDVELLVKEFLRQLDDGGGARSTISEQAMKRLCDYHWPGNVRELKNVVERAFILAENEIDVDSLPPTITGEEKPEGPFLRVRVGTPVAEVERRLILATLDQFGGNKNETAKALGVSVKTVYNRLNSYERDDAETVSRGADRRARPGNSEGRIE